MTLNLNDSRYADIPSCGVPLVDNIQHRFGDEKLRSTEYRQRMGNEFRQVCRNVARDKQLSKEEKIIWARAAINSINKTYVIANAKNDYGCTNLTSEFCAILESEYLQIPEPICVKRIAMEIGAMDIFEETAWAGVYITLDAHGNMVIPVNDEVPDGEPLHEEYLCLCLLKMEMGDTWEFYQKKVCTDCDLESCLYDICPENKSRVSEQEDSSQILELHPELQQLIDAGLIDANFQLTADSSRRKIVAYCDKHDLFTPRRMAEWRRIDGILKDEDGMPIPATSLKQATQDYERDQLA